MSPNATLASNGISIERWTKSSRVALGCMAAVLVLLMFAPTVLGAGAIDRMTALFIYVILAAMWNALAGFGGLVSVGQQVFFGPAPISPSGLRIRGSIPSSRCLPPRS